ncbi:uncharacterized protein LOC131148966 [Malania oleifera]|uniref:uncharacterized protein LOC131148966 n=1 Tax=Malania oleifera TaxID=397392 RepID=UPI0025AEAA94|nr:uncharacterized protein LOC131148966 [Malania oleifera]
MQEIEKVLIVLQCTEEHRVLFATYKLTGEAERWWTAVKLLKQKRSMPIEITWDRFKEIFFNSYFPTSSREAKVEEFLNSKQGSQTMQQYTARFIELSRFTPYIIPNEMKKARQFEKVLRKELYKQVAILKLQDFAELVDRAVVAKAGVRMDVKE